MSVMTIVMLANLAIGALIGLCGVAGFLLPMLYTGFLGMEVSQSLALSFLAFLVSGILGAYNYHRDGNLALKFSCVLGVGSFIGGIAGVRLNFMIAPSHAKALLYLVVLLSGVSILLRERKKPGKNSGGGMAGGVGGADGVGTASEDGKTGGGKMADGVGTDGAPSPFLGSNVFTVLFGLVTGTICSLSGAGGPVLVMPLLVSLGMEVRTAVGVALFDSVFIALPAFAGYMRACSPVTMLPLLAAAAVAHGVGVIIGSKNATRIPAGPLKIGVAVFSILIAAYMLYGMIAG